MVPAAEGRQTRLNQNRGISISINPKGKSRQRQKHLPEGEKAGNSHFPPGIWGASRKCLCPRAAGTRRPSPDGISLGFKERIPAEIPFLSKQTPKTATKNKKTSILFWPY